MSELTYLETIKNIHSLPNGTYTGAWIGNNYYVQIKPSVYWFNAKQKVRFEVDVTLVVDGRMIDIYQGKED